MFVDLFAIVIAVFVLLLLVVIVLSLRGVLCTRSTYAFFSRKLKNYSYHRTVYEIFCVDSKYLVRWSYSDSSWVLVVVLSHSFLVA